MKEIIFGAIFFASIHFGWANELELIPLDQTLRNVGLPVTCESCQTDEVDEPFKKIDPNEAGTCLKNIGHGSYLEYRVCSSSAANVNEFLYYQITQPHGDQSGLSRRNREIFIKSLEESFNGTFLTFQDVDSSIRAAQQMGSDIFLLPRKVKPSMSVSGYQLRIKLQTGEEVILDKDTKQIISGALREGPPSFGSATQPANVHYNGSGISIRMDLRTYDDPRKKSINATVTQGTKSCTVP